MKIKNLILISIFLVMVIMFVPNTVNAAVGEKFTVDDVEYSINTDDTTVTVSDYKGDATKTELSIPEKVTYNSTEYSVTIIGKNAFDLSNLKTIQLPNTIKTIEEQAFYRCKELISINIPDSVTSIGDMAFRQCEKLTSIKVPDSVTTIGFEAFGYCYSLTNLELSNSITTINKWLLQGSRKLKSLVIPKSVDTIADKAFIHSGLVELYFEGEKPSNIGKELFDGCDEDINIYVPYEYYESYKNAFSDVDVSYCKVETKDNVDTYTMYYAGGKKLVFDVTNGTDGKDGEDGKDGITPQIKINETTGELEVSYDKGNTWTSLGKVVGEDGKDGQDGINGTDGKNGKDGKDATSTTTTKGKDGEDGKDGITPKLRINDKTGELETSYDEGKTWSSLGAVVGKDGADGKTEVIQNEANIKYGIVEYIICALAVLGNIGWIVALKRRK